MKSLGLLLKNLRRNKLRSVLTVVAVVVLVALFSMIMTVLRFLHLATSVQKGNVRTVITERYRLPSRFDRALMDQIVTPGTIVNRDLVKIPGFRNDMHNVWHFVVFTLDPVGMNPDLGFFVIAMYPEKIPTMMDSMEGLDLSLPGKMKDPPVSKLKSIGVVMGPERLAKLGKKVGDVFKATSLSHRAGISGRPPIEMEFEVVGMLPAGSRWVNGAFMDYAYLERVLHEQKSEMDGKVNLGWLMLDDQETAAEVSGVLLGQMNDIKHEVAANAVARFLDGFKDLLNGVRYLLSPAIVIVMTVIVANAIGITVRERITEMAVLKVLGFPRGRILALVLGEGMILGLVGGFLGALFTFTLVNKVFGGINLRIAFFDIFFVPVQVFWWGPALGVATALVGSILPAWGAQKVKVSEVFAKVA